MSKKLDQFLPKNESKCTSDDKGFITLDGEINSGGVIFIDGLRHNSLSVGQLVDRGYHLQFRGGRCPIRDQLGNVIVSGSSTKVSAPRWCAKKCTP